MSSQLRITKKQAEILRLLYSYRFLSRIHIQQLMGHRDKKTINLWLRDLKAKGCVAWKYDSHHFALKTKPAVYYLDLSGIRFLKTVTTTLDDGTTQPTYPTEQLRKRYKEAGRSESYIERCLLLADCAISFTVQARQSQATGCTITTQADYADEDNEYHFLTDGDLGSQLGPQLVITQHHGEKITGSYLLEVFDANLPQYRVRRRLKQYVTFLAEGEWEANREDADSLPQVLFICMRTTDLLYAKRRTRGLKGELWDDEDKRKVQIHFAAMENIRAHGVTANIWE